jgi:hypothetical protein
LGNARDDISKTQRMALEPEPALWRVGVTYKRLNREIKERERKKKSGRDVG